ncbi:uncharacterized protein isoform X2 [Choristoneura fumiferana]|uniref:uncharacterized protein isoform X2 n=1 Tax=Choristoneura fumiferana TaxID=7141 RepID=UPI003D15AA05
MGVWRFTMPLLSTLAAMVIIVHSAEDLDPEFRRGLRPRAVDPGTTSYEQPWKSIDTEPLAQQSTHADVWGDDSLEEQAARRRPVRKRKRRPQISSENEPDDTQRENPPGSYPEKDYHDSHDSHQSETVRRRRKRPDIRPYRWADEPIERPLRRRGLRRKRPTIDSNPRLSEFDSLSPNLTDTKDDHQEKNLDDQQEKLPITENIETFDSEDGRKPKPALDYYDPDPTNVDYNINDDDRKHEEKNPSKISTSEETPFQERKLNNYHKLSELQLQDDSSEDHGYSNKPITPHNSGVTVDQSLQDEAKEEDQQAKPLAEFSKDVTNTNKNERLKANEKPATNTEKDIITFKAQDYDPIDPYTLKQILKRSNGTSLSEILQRHNLSLTDLLRGRGEAILALHTEPPDDRPPPQDVSLENDQQEEVENRYIIRNQATTQRKPMRDSLDKNEDNIESAIQTENYTSHNSTETETDNKHVRNIPRIITNRHFPIGIRRKLRMRPMLNSTIKAQLGRDLIALSARKYFQNHRNMSKLKEWKEIIPIMTNRSKLNDGTTTPEATESTPTTTTTEAFDDTTVMDSDSLDSLSSPSSDTEESYGKDNEVETISISTSEPTTTITMEAIPTEINTEADKPKVIPIARPAADAFALRRQAFNNRLKRKRLKQKSSTTENPKDDLTKNFFGMANLVSASEFIERTQKPQTTVTQGSTENVTELEDFMTTHSPTTVEDKVKSIRITTSGYTLPSATQSSTSASTTAQSAKVEIDEILNDRMTSERLAKILLERNMTLGELVMHRERGSSHVHLADIFHNASKEPNPPEPFLTKSSLEPISKETYPLRAILEANTYDATARPTSQATSSQGNNMHIPVVMDFGNNVNENGENMGIISLFKNKLENEKIDNAEIRKDSHGTPYISSVISVNTTITNDANRESRVLGDTEDIRGWNELLTLINKHNISTTIDDLTSVTQDILPLDKNKINLEDVDGDGLIILEDLQHLKDFDSNIASGSDEKLEVRMYETSEAITDKPGILNKIPNNTRSVAIATASILGLATLLFLLTYIAFRYKQQRDRLRKKDSFCNERIPSPVFEHRKGHKNNCSSRSISPMISTSNIYTMSTLDSHNGKDSPDYMWNSLRKPFQ